MRRGERCRLHVAPQYAFGERGSFSFPSVPPSADVEYEVELFDFEAVAEDRPRSSLTFEERLEAAARRRLEGNEHFQGCRFGEALGRYQLALSYVDEELMIQLDGAHADKAAAARSALLLNAAACELRVEDWHGAIAHCQEVLGTEPKNVKALFRRGKAQLRLGNTDGAATDLGAAHRLAPDDAGIDRELRELQRQLRQERAAESSLFRGRLSPAAPAGSAQSPSQSADTSQPRPAHAPAANLSQLASSWLVTGLVNLIRALQRALGWFMPTSATAQPS